MNWRGSRLLSATLVCLLCISTQQVWAANSSSEQLSTTSIHTPTRTKESAKATDPRLAELESLKKQLEAAGRIKDWRERERQMRDLNNQIKILEAEIKGGRPNPSPSPRSGSSSDPRVAQLESLKAQLTAAGRIRDWRKRERTIRRLNARIRILEAQIGNPNPSPTPSPSPGSGSGSYAEMLAELASLKQQREAAGRIKDWRERERQMRELDDKIKILEAQIAAAKPRR